MGMEPKSRNVLVALALFAALFTGYFYMQYASERNALKNLQEENEREQKVLVNRSLLDSCLLSADTTATAGFSIICASDPKISGGTKKGEEACYTAPVEDALGYMAVSEFRDTHFKGVLERRNEDREECFRKFPQ